MSSKIYSVTRSNEYNISLIYISDVYVGMLSLLDIDIRKINEYVRYYWSPKTSLFN